MKTLLFILCCLPLLSGCNGLFNAYNKRDVIRSDLASDNAHSVQLGALSVTSQRRMILANMRSGDFCAEPPPEAVDNITSSINAALRSSLESDVSARSLDTTMKEKSSQNINQLYRRVHTLQLFRDAAFHYCVDAVNSSNHRQNKDYVSYASKLDNVLSKLIPVLEHEITLYYKKHTIDDH